MTGKTHIIGGILAETLFLEAAKSDTKMMAACVAVAGFAALIPDIDCPTSTIGKPLFFLSMPINKLCGHRGFFHAPFLYLILWIAAWTATRHNIFVNAAFIGIASHLLLDSCNPSGIPWLYPFSKKKQHLAKIYTGKLGDSMVAVIMTIAWVYLTFPAISQNMGLSF